MPTAWEGGQVTARATCVLCPNPGPMTLDGTNTWVLSEPGSDRCVVVDPGPLDEGHLARVLQDVEGRGARVELTLLTHHHWDHAESAQRFAELTGAPVRAIGPGHDDLTEGDTVRAAGLEVGVVATPGHTGDSVSFLLPADGVLLTGDTVLGRGTTVVAWPDGELSAYLDSLERIARLTDPARDGGATAILPGHGPTVPDAAGTVRYYLEHRKERLEQVRAALADGAAGADDVADAVVERVYADVPREVWPAARLSVLAQLDYLRERG
ncbi:MAG TPA: MBL fold metallo-hydrolase [Segeticoccus sp.]|uniref:MBL fold metallo-hydrolase n=1 Tax=Segeticoccus sp. TaxID=2706531 RepID=UPI002D802CFB|nr:MBL fold metallo-hydrolase [Segeticoccus sp.]HET8599007.1 MBL fold metallo-hydrolase [Segeticoccus sp.]